MKLRKSPTIECIHTYIHQTKAQTKKEYTEGEVKRTSNLLYNINSQADMNHIPEGDKRVRTLVPVDLELGHSWAAC